MRFGPLALEEAVGAIVAHGIQGEAFVLKKGERVRLEHVALLRAAGIDEIVVAKLEAGDVGENEAAERIAVAVGGAELSIDRAFTGRVNLFARHAGVLTIDVEAIDRLNEVDEALTFASLPPFRAVVAGEMVATVKIIPFAVPRVVLETALDVGSRSLIDVSPFRPLRVAVVSTVLPGLKPAVVKKTLGHLADRLAIADASIVADVRVPHDMAALAQALGAVTAQSDLIIVFGASAITDRRDVIPAGLVEAGGTIEHFGMPVDPGNLLLLGALHGKPVIGAPGCARSPKENGFDWILQRLLAGLSVTRSDIRRLGVGGLLMEIVSRPQPRAGEVGSDASSLVPDVVKFSA